MQKNSKGDSYFYAEEDNDSGLVCVFGDNSGFAYANYLDMEQAERKATEMNLDFQKRNDSTHEGKDNDD